jgi:DNA-binding winged helix-turn-helix (wHTH) protein
MSVPPPEICGFGPIRFHIEKLLLYCRGELVKTVDRKSLQVLAVLVRRPGEVVSYDEIIDEVWSDNHFGVTSARVNQYVSKLQKLFTACDPNVKYFENIKGRGYRFIPQPPAPPETIASPGVSDDKGLSAAEWNQKTVAPNSTSTRRTWLISAFAALAVCSLTAAAWVWSREDERTAVERVLRESQHYESLVLYKHPAAFKEEDLDKYWAPASEALPNPDRLRIRDAVRKMAAEGLRYGDETRSEQFDIQELNIDKDGTTATARTLEKWFVAVYGTDGTLHKNRTIGPYFVNYILRKINGRWLVEKSTTARVARPIPHLTDVEAVTAPIHGQEFLVRITGKDIEPTTVYLEVVGPGCPDSKPCKVPNSALLERSKLSDAAMENVPLTLATGEFRIVAYNGDSKASNPVYLRVP